MPVKLTLTSPGTQASREVVFEKAEDTSDVTAHNLQHEIQFVAAGKKLGVPLGTTWEMEVTGKKGVKSKPAEEGTIDIVLDKVDHQLLTHILSQVSTSDVERAMSAEHAQAFEALQRQLMKLEGSF